MKIPRELLRARAIQAIAIVVVLATVPQIASAFLPSAAKYFPPPLLSMLVLGSAFNALLVWRSEWLLSRLFPGVSALDIGVVKNASAKAQRLGAAIGLAFSIVSVILWVRSFL